MYRINRPRWGKPAVFGLLALAAITVGRSVWATEASDDLEVWLRVVELVPGKGPAGPSMTGVARIEVLVQAFRETRDVELRVLSADGSPFDVKGRPLSLGRPAWRGPGGEAVEPDADGQAVSARGAIRATIVVPLQGAAIHEIVVSVTGLAAGRTVATSGVARVALGVADNQPVDDGTYVNFSVSEVR